MDIGRVFATSGAMLRQRFWPLVGMWAVFLAIQTAGSVVLGIAALILGAAGVAGLGGGIEDPAAITGMGIGMILVMVVFYGAYIVILLAQQAAMVTLASPLEEPAFGAAMARGIRSAMPFFALTVVVGLAYVALLMAVAAGTDAAGPAFAAVLLLAGPAMVYCGCRLAVLVPVVAVDQVFNPVAALRRSWAVTRGKVLSILLALLGFVALTLVIFGLPVLLVFGAVLGSDGNPQAAAGAAIIGVLLFVPVLIVYSLFAAAFTAALHSEATGGGAEALEEVFA